MKKKIIVLVLIASMSIINDLKNEKVTIPKQSIRFRVVANSNNEEDQNLKLKVKNNLKKEINNVMNQANNIEEAREMIKNNILTFQDNINKTLEKENIKLDYKIKYGMNYFPEKEYKKVVYKEGEYESLVITLGEGKGDNFWCVLFPPLCLLDAKENNSTEKIKYHLLIKDILDKYI